MSSRIFSSTAAKQLGCSAASPKCQVSLKTVFNARLNHGREPKEKIAQTVVLALFLVNHARREFESLWRTDSSSSEWVVASLLWSKLPPLLIVDLAPPYLNPCHQKTLNRQKAARALRFLSAPKRLHDDEDRLPARKFFDFLVSKSFLLLASSYRNHQDSRIRFFVLVQWRCQSEPGASKKPKITWVLVVFDNSINPWG